MLSLTTVLNLQNAAIIKSGAICFSLLLDNQLTASIGNDSNLLIVFYVQIMPDDFVMQLHRF